MADEMIRAEDTEEINAEFMGAGEEFRSLYAQNEEINAELKRVAMRMQESGERAGAEVLRQVSGQVMEFLGEVIAATGSHFEAIEGEMENQGGTDGLDIEDAKALYRTFVANNKLWNDVKSQATSDQRETIDKIIGMNEESMKLVVDLSDDDLPQMIEEEVKQATDGAGTPN